MKAHRFLTYCLSTPWAMEPHAMQVYAAILARAYAGRLDIEVSPRAGGADEDDHGAPLKTAPFAAAGSRSSGNRAGAGSIAVIQVFGPLVQRASQLGPCEDGTGADGIGAALNAAIGDDTVGQILLEFDTPGGSVFGIDELAAQIRSQRADKPIIGLANSLCASAGYYLMSQCSECYVTPGGMVGSIGVYSAHQDISKALDDMGVKVSLVSAGKYKVEGNPFEPLGDDARGAIQSSVNDYYDKFVKAVAKGRGVGVDTVRDGMGEGRVLNADAAFDQKMVDGIMTFPEVVKKMQRDAKQSRSGARSAQLRAHEIDMLEVS